MNKNEKPSFLKGRGAAVGIVLCFVAVIAMVGTLTFNNSQRQKSGQIAKNGEDTADITEDREATADNIVAAGDKKTGPQDESKEDLPPQDSDKNEQTTEDDGESTVTDTEQTGTKANQVWFSEESMLEWPASGPLLMSYSMDETVYFSTLDQYKYNPALIISGEVGEPIGAAAPGIVKDVSENAQTGMTVTLDMGNGYTAVYGQLADISVSAGEYLNTGDMIGSLSEPTKYYSVEGPNLYFEMRKDGQPIDPMNFME